jgi:hypothetical protein
MNVQPIHDPHHMKNLILNSSEPILFRRKLDWKLLTWSLEDWDTILQDKELNFRCGINSHTKVSSMSSGNDKSFIISVLL